MRKLFKIVILIFFYRSFKTQIRTYFPLPSEVQKNENNQMIKPIFIAFFVSLTHAQDLKINKKGVVGEKLPPNAFSTEKGCTSTEVIDLYAPGKPLHGIGQQDQDGLNTCYGNTASLMIKSINPELPVPSYLDIASYNNNQYSMSGYDFDYGFPCEVINKISYKSESLTLCPQGTFEEGHFQADVIHPLYNEFSSPADGKNPDDVRSIIRDDLQLNPFPLKLNECTDRIESSHLQYVIKNALELATFKNDTSKKKCLNNLENNKDSIGWRLLTSIRNSGGERRVIDIFKRYDLFEYYNKLEQNHIDSLNQSLASSTQPLKELALSEIHKICPENDFYEPFKDTLERNHLLPLLYNSCHRTYKEWQQKMSSCNSQNMPSQFYEMLSNMGNLMDNMKLLGVKYNRSVLGKMIDANCPQKINYPLKNLKCSNMAIGGVGSDVLLESFYSSLKKQRVIAVDTCSSIFSKEEKNSFKDCREHSVAVTGLKCGYDKRPKVLVSNSWGIACKDKFETRHLVQCEKDSYGVTTGRAWVDLEYLVHPNDARINLFSE